MKINLFADAATTDTVVIVAETNYGEFTELKFAVGNIMETAFIKLIDALEKDTLNFDDYEYDPEARELVSKELKRLIPDIENNELRELLDTIFFYEDCIMDINKIYISRNTILFDKDNKNK